MKIYFRAKTTKSAEDWTYGFYACLHLATFDVNEQLTGFKEEHAIFNDEERSRSFWTTIDPDTLCQLTPMCDVLGAPIWEHARVRIYELTCESPHLPLHGVEGEVIMMSSGYGVETDDGRSIPIVYLHASYDLLVIG